MGLGNYAHFRKECNRRPLPIAKVYSGKSVMPIKKAPTYLAGSVGEQMLMNCKDDRILKLLKEETQ